MSFQLNVTCPGELCIMFLYSWIVWAKQTTAKANISRPHYLNNYDHWYAIICIPVSPFAVRTIRTRTTRWVRVIDRTCTALQSSRPSVRPTSRPVSSSTSNPRLNRGGNRKHHSKRMVTLKGLVKSWAISQSSRSVIYGLFSAEWFIYWCLKLLLLEY